MRRTKYKLLISLRLYLEPHTHSLIVRQQLERVFGDRLSTDGEAGFFYPDNFSVGQPVRHSQVIARAMALPGIKRVEVTRFRRADGDGDVLEVPIGPGEIARLGRIDFDLKKPTLAAGTDDGVFRSTNGGKSWKPANISLPGMDQKTGLAKEAA